MSEKPKTITLETLARGAVEEVFAEELRKVLANIDDPNTEPEDTRKLVLTLTLKPDAKRQTVGIKVGVKPSYAAVRKIETAAFLGRVDGKLALVENDPRQMGLEFDGPPKPEAIEDHRSRKDGAS